MAVSGSTRLRRVDPISSQAKVNYKDEDEEEDGAIVPLDHMLEVDKQNEGMEEDVQEIGEKIQLIQQVRNHVRETVI